MRIQSPYLTEGYCIEPAVLAEPECNTLLAALASANRSHAGARHLMRHPAVASTARNERLLRIASEALGQDAAPFRATLFEKTGRANWLVAWHQDTALPLAARFDDAGWGPWSQKAGVLGGGAFGSKDEMSSSARYAAMWR